MHHKRKGPKSTRAGCLMCKPHKAHGWCPRHKNMKFGVRRDYEAASHKLRCQAV
jgi:hypothetical protein